MEALPPELKLKILKRIDYPALKAVVHASPAYHAVYRSFRLELLTSVTLKHLEEIGFNLNPPSTWPKHIHAMPGCPDYRRVEICVPKPGPPTDILAAAFNSYFTHLERSEGRRGPLRLLVAECVALLSIKALLATDSKAGEVRRSRDAKAGIHHFSTFVRILSGRTFPESCRCWRTPEHEHRQFRLGLHE